MRCATHQQRRLDVGVPLQLTDIDVDDCLAVVVRRRECCRRVLRIHVLRSDFVCVWTCTDSLVSFELGVLRRHTTYNDHIGYYSHRNDAEESMIDMLAWSV